MQVQAYTKYARMSPKKVREITRPSKAATLLKRLKFFASSRASRHVS